MGYRVKGTLKLPDGSPASNAEIEFISRKNFSPLVQELKSNILCGPTGAYDVTLELGEYAVMVYPGGTYPAALGTIILAADTVAGQDLPTLLQQSGWQPATPEYIQQIAAWLAEANASATSSAASASAAKVSETNSKASENAALSSKNSAASSASTATTKAAEAASSASAALASKNAAAASEANALASKDAAAASASTAVVAADTATQKALAAAGSEASALSSATRAEQAAQALVGAIIDAGPYNAASGVLPTPSMSSGVKRSSVWKVTGSGTAGGIELGVGDSLVYTASDSSYYKIDNTESVTSVNGRKGVVTLSSSDVGADDYGTAQSLVTQHAEKSGAHAISGVSGLQDALNAKEVTGAATSAVDGHAAKSGAHPISGVSGLQASLDSKYSASNKPTAADIQNVVSPVSSGGIIEQGSNANGEYVKFADGTMICTLKGNMVWGATAPYGTLHQATVTWTYPVIFSSNPSVSCGGGTWGTGASWCTVSGVPSATVSVLRYLDISTRESATIFTMATAIGRWK